VTPTDRDPGFFVAYLKIPPAYARFSLAVAAVFLALLGGLSLAVGSRVPDPGDGFFDGKSGYQTLVGVLEARPYPVLRVLPDDEYPEGRALMLSGTRKEGVQAEAEELRGQIVDVGGFYLRRGDLDMINVGGKVGVRATEAELSEAERDFTPAPAEPLGRWRLVGEICDGKCLGGAMRPGAGLSHKACANLCVTGGVPPVFVSTGEVDGTSFFLLGDAEGGPLPDRIRDLMALRLEVEGEVERRDDILVFKIDVDSARAL
jgi:hypothetical protein